MTSLLSPSSTQTVRTPSPKSTTIPSFTYIHAGFVFTQSSERMGRKNRSKNGNHRCLGVDNNRNWPLGWGGKGSSKDPCAETFSGPSAVSEPENKNMIAFLEKVAKEQKLQLFVDWHSYSQLVMSRKNYLPFPLHHFFLWMTPTTLFHS